MNRRGPSTKQARVLRPEDVCPLFQRCPARSYWPYSSPFPMWWAGHAGPSAGNSTTEATITMPGPQTLRKLRHHAPRTLAATKASLESGDSPPPWAPAPRHTLLSTSRGRGRAPRTPEEGPRGIQPQGVAPRQGRLFRLPDVPRSRAPRRRAVGLGEAATRSTRTRGGGHAGRASEGGPALPLVPAASTRAAPIQPRELSRRAARSRRPRGGGPWTHKKGGGEEGWRRTALRLESGDRMQLFTAVSVAFALVKLTHAQSAVWGEWAAIGPP